MGKLVERLNWHCKHECIYYQKECCTSKYNCEFRKLMLSTIHDAAVYRKELSNERH